MFWHRLFRSVSVMWLAALLAIPMTVFAAAVIFDAQQSGEVMSGVRVLGKDVGNLKKEDAEQKIKNIYERHLDFPIKVKNSEEFLTLRDLGVRLSAVRDADRAFQVGKGRTFAYRAAERVRAMSEGVDLPMSVQIDEERMQNVLAKFIGANEELDLPVAQFAVRLLAMGVGERVLEIPVRVKMENNKIETESDVVLPKIHEFNFYNVYKKKSRCKGKICVYLRDETELQVFEIPKKEFCETKSEKCEVDRDFLRKFFEKELAPKIFVEMTGATIVRNKSGSGKVSVIGFARDGREMDVEKMVDLTVFALENEDEALIGIPFLKKKAKINGIEELGLVDLLATGISDFSESSEARIHNVKRGFEVSDLVLVAPGGIFSFNKHLPDVNARNGFLPEVVILGDRSEKQYGGGLCQVSTTHYRAAIAAGLTMTQRRNHRYMVFHYEPAGTDATIYPPFPDMRWKNDTKGYILVQTMVNFETEMSYVNLYGTDDGRKVTRNGPWKSKWRKPPADVIVYDKSMPTGRRKKTDDAMWGFTVVWERKVVSATGAVMIDEEIKSRYTPWPNRWVVGAG